MNMVALENVKAAQRYRKRETRVIAPPALRKLLCGSGGPAASHRGTLSAALVFPGGTPATEDKTAAAGAVALQGRHWPNRRQST